MASFSRRAMAAFRREQGTSGRTDSLTATTQRSAKRSYAGCTERCTSKRLHSKRVQTASRGRTPRTIARVDTFSPAFLCLSFHSGGIRVASSVGFQTALVVIERLDRTLSRRSATPPPRERVVSVLRPVSVVTFHGNLRLRER